ncbi:heparanase-like isoform X2 [Babylonia areolata]|uniref:heparanase-like isoform X2 n=1 Tax=Babylonia areolata TaxID=304850 RepID=UPI003FD3191D
MADSRSLTTGTGLLVFCLLALTPATTTAVAAENVRVFAVQGDREPKGHNSGQTMDVTVDLQQSLNTITSHFIGVTIDAGLILLNWSTLDFGSQRVQSMARALSPSYFRLGGTYADTMTYELGDRHDRGVDRSYDTAKVPQFNLTAQQWDAVNRFSQVAGWDFIMDLNALKRNPDGSWNPDNARQLLEYSARHNFSIPGFELGNEYDVYKQSFNVSVSPVQLAKDVATLKGLLAEFPAYSSSFIIGPEAVTNLLKYFEGYYFYGPGAPVSKFLDTKVMSSLEDKVQEVLAMSRFVNPLLPVWLSETSSSYDSGTPNVSDRFVAGFLWLDKLGVCASRGIQTVIRQSFYGGHYSLVNADLDPNPDFWLTVLYKRIVRGAVFNVTAPSDVRAYAACANGQQFKAGSVAVYMLNPNATTKILRLSQFSDQWVWLYSLTAGDHQGLLSKFMSLNGVKLELIDNHLPDLTPKAVYGGDVVMEPFSFVFVVAEDARATICLEQR